MKARIADFPYLHIRPSNLCLMLLIGLGSSLSYADESDFLACARYTNRAIRFACLDATLQKAIKQQNPTANSPISEENKSLPRPVDNRAANQERVDTFGLEQETRVVSTGEGTEELQDEITALNSIKPNMWDITLNGGQVWRQVLPKRFDLRPGDMVRIYPSRWGNNFRLTTSRLSGFIQVSRVK